MFDILELMEKMPSGVIDEMAVAKLATEMAEFDDAVGYGDSIDVALELADIVYYAIKIIALYSDKAYVDVETALAFCKAKYTLRARGGNPKSYVEERLAIARLMGEEHGS